MINVLLIGSGTMGQVHAKAYQQMDNVTLVGVVDQNEHHGQIFAENHYTDYYPSLESALQQSSVTIDVVDICLPTHVHDEYVMKVADIGLPIICEKPIAHSLEKAQEMITYCKEKNVQLFIGHVVRFFPEYVRAKQLIDQGHLGKIAMVRTKRGGVFPTATQHDWYADQQLSGGTIVDLMIHDFDFLRWCFGEVTRVYAKSIIEKNIHHIDYSLVTLRFASGIIAHVEGTWAHKGFSSSFEIAGENGVIDYDSNKAHSIQLYERELGTNEIITEGPLLYNPYYRELHHFLQCIKDGSEPIVTAHDGYKALEIAHAAIQSLRKRKPITLLTE